MKDIRFRAWDNQTNKFEYWDSETNKYDGIFWLMIKRPEFEKPEQFTGLYDKSKEPIYDGDILVSNSTSPEYTVTWEIDRWKMCGRKNGNGFSIAIPDFMKIISNIHEEEV